MGSSCCSPNPEATGSTDRCAAKASRRDDCCAPGPLTANSSNAQISASGECCAADSLDKGDCCASIAKPAYPEKCCVADPSKKDQCCTSVPPSEVSTTCCDNQASERRECCTSTPPNPGSSDSCAPENHDSEDCCRSGTRENVVTSEDLCQSCPECPPGGADCCNESCIDRAAAIECRAECGPEKHGKPTCVMAAPSSRPSSELSLSLPPSRMDKATADDTASSKACDDHTRSARQRYQAVAGVLNCICRILLANNLESCCRPRRGGGVRSFGNGGYARKKSSQVRVNDKSSCCRDRECVEDRITVAPAATCCSSGGCSEKSKARLMTQELALKQEYGVHVVDIEKGGPQYEHIVLSVQGMTCVGCELKFSRSLTAFSQIQNLKISVVLARAEFDLDISRMAVDEVIAYLSRATEFTCERVTSKGHEVEVSHPGGSKALINQKKPLGVTHMKATTKQVVRIAYDPQILGARDLLGRSFDVPLHLAPMKPPASIEAGSKEVRKDGLLTLFSCLLTIPVLVLAWAPLPERPIIYGSVSLALATIIQVVVAGPFYPIALKNLIFSRLIEVDLLIVLSTSAAYLFSVIAFAYQAQGNPLQTKDFFEASALIVSLIMLGRLISSWARQRAAESISFRTLQSSTAVLVDTKSTSELEIDARLLHYGDIFKVSPESRIVTDGTVVSGASEVDESMVTGESRPVPKEIGSPVIAGSMNGSGLLHVRLSRLLGGNTINTIADMVDEAKMTKAKTQEIADRIAGWFVPVVVCITIVTFVGWIGFGIGNRGYSGSEAAENAITYAIAVLIVSCPCAIGLCVPMVIVIAGGVAAKHGVIFRTGQTMEIAKNTTHVVFDKTGTLTEGLLSVVAETYPEDNESIIRPFILGLVANVKHPVSAAVSRYLKDQGILQAQIDDVTTVIGKGVQGISNGRKITAGNCRWLQLEHHNVVQKYLSQGLTVFCAVIDGQVGAVFGLEDSIRPDSLGVISELKQRKISVSIVSGDDDGAVQKLASRLGVPQTHLRSRCTPKEKLDYLREIMKDKQSVVMFCGDGTNDAPALAQANVGVHINEGSEIAQSAADAVLVRPALSGILCLMDLSRAAVKRITFNFCWSFTYNLFAVLLAAGLFVKWRIPPAYAALGEVISVLPVIAIALLLRYIKLQH